MAIKRLQKEIADLRADPTSCYCFIKPLADDCLKLRMVFLVPQGTPYEGGFIELEYEFPFDYPFNPPRVRFQPGFLHMNVDENGAMGLAILHEHWSPALTLQKVVFTIQALVTDPNPRYYADAGKECSDISMSTEEQRISDLVDRVFHGDTEARTELRDVDSTLRATTLMKRRIADSVRSQLNQLYLSDKREYDRVVRNWVREHIAKQPDWVPPGTFFPTMVITCNLADGHITCTNMGGEAVGLFQVPEGVDPFGDWLVEEVLSVASRPADLRLVHEDGQVIFSGKLLEDDTILAKKFRCG
jgi:ubiquitin-conjugating enzyme E2 D/E